MILPFQRAGRVVLDKIYLGPLNSSSPTFQVVKITHEDHPGSSCRRLDVGVGLGAKSVDQWGRNEKRNLRCG